MRSENLPTLTCESASSCPKQTRALPPNAREIQESTYLLVAMYQDCISTRDLGKVSGEF